MDFFDLITMTGTYGIRFSNRNGSLCYSSTKEIPQEFSSCISKYECAILLLLNRFKSDKISLFPLSYNQQSMWFSYQLNPESSSYNVAIPVHITDSLNSSKVVSVIESCIACYDQLRAVFDFPEENSTFPCQIILDSCKPDITTLEVPTWSESQCVDYLTTFYKKPFTLSLKPPFRVLILSRSGTDHYLLFVFHHIIIDAFSIGIFLRYFEHHYTNSDIAADKQTSYSEFCLFQKEYVQKYCQTDISFFKSKLTNNNEYSIPADFTKYQNSDTKGSTEYFNLELSVAEEVSHFAKSLSITPFSVYLGVFQLVHMFFSDTFQSRLGVLTHGRSAQSINTFGNFVNPLPLFSIRNANQTLKEHLKSTALESLELQDHSFCPFSLLVEKLLPNRNNRNFSFFTELFNMHSKKQLGIGADLLYTTDYAKKLTFCGFNAFAVPFNQQEGQFRLTMEIIDGSNSVTGILKYRDDCFTYTTIKQMVTLYQSLLNQIKTTPDLKLSDLFKLIGSVSKTESQTLNITIASTFTSELLHTTFKFWATELSVKIQDHYAPYNQLFHLLNDPSGILMQNKGFNVFLIRVEDFCNYYYDHHFDQNEVINKMNEFFGLIERSVPGPKEGTIIIFCPPSSKLNTRKDIADFISSQEQSFTIRLNSLSSVVCFSSLELLHYYDNISTYEPGVGIIGHVPYTDAFFSILGTFVIRIILTFKKPPCKLIIVDCDNTLWKGVAGEDTLEQISIPDSMKVFQKLLKSKKDSGILLGICSKNNEKDTIEVIKKHPDMILSLDDFSFVKINWEIKSKNITSILKDANLSTSGVFFIDDNPAECAEVIANCQGISVIQLPSEINNRPAFLKHFWLLDNFKITKEDHDRALKYQQEMQRNQFKEKAISFSEFIQGLDLKISIKKAIQEDISRISQLSFRTNQFTLGTSRYSEEQICNLINNSGLFIVEVSDRFGNYGLVGVIYLAGNSNMLLLDTFLLSCRALGRGVEYRMLSFIGNYAEENGFELVSIKIAVTAKNVPLRHFFKDLATEYLSMENSDSQYYTIPATYLKEIIFNPEKLKNDQFTSLPKDSKVDQKDSLTPDDTIFSGIANRFSNADFLISAIYPDYNKPVFIAPPMRGTLNLEQTKNIITDIFCKSIGICGVDQNDNFFDIGGKSILIPSIINQISKVLNITVTILDIFQFPTITALSEHIYNKSNVAVNVQ